MTDMLDQFRKALAERNIIPPSQIIADGRIHRCDVEGKGGKGDGAYLLYADDIAAGGFENWRDGLGWQKWRSEFATHLSKPVQRLHNQHLLDLQKRYQLERAQREAVARAKASDIWAKSLPCEFHPYLSRKGIAAHGLRLYKETLVVPLLDSEGDLHSLQFIFKDGQKRFLAGGKTLGHYYLIGEPENLICIAEGFATAASIHESTGFAVVVAFNAGNLQSVAQTIHHYYPNLPVVICADDDYETDPNVGLLRAAEAARSIGGYVVAPEFIGSRPENATDFNDLFLHGGPDAVRACLERTVSAMNADTEVPEESAMQPDLVMQAPTMFECPEGRFEVRVGGVFFSPLGDSDNPSTARWVCSPLYIRAMTRDEKSGEWGRLLEWQDADGKSHRWAMPMELLHGDGADVRKELVRQGLQIATSRSVRDLLATYISRFPIDTRAKCVERVGWHGNVYVLPAQLIGSSDEQFVFQNTHAVEPAFSIAGTAEEWKGKVGGLAIGNSRLTFALSIAFAAPLLELSGEDSGGFHFRGSSSTGKTTALKVAASVYGNPKTYSRLWRATTNGLEGLAALHNDGLLVLDELSQLDPRSAGEAAYLLANGQGKARASRNGSLRSSPRWKLLLLSSGEESLQTLMNKAGSRINAGQEVRLADIEADAGAGLGLFEELHGYPAAADLANGLKTAIEGHYGAVGLRWLERIVESRETLKTRIRAEIDRFVQSTVPIGASGQVIRVARRFGLVAIAGELASELGLTGWPQGAGTDAACNCFHVWMEAFGSHGTKEEQFILAQVRAYFEKHGASRFEDMHATEEQRVPNRAGFFCYTEKNERQFLVLPEVYRKEICEGFEFQHVTKVLVRHGWIKPDKDGKGTQKPRIPALGKTTRCYVFTGKMWDDNE